MSGKGKENDTLTHLDEAGQARMVDVGAKPPTARRAVAAARVRIGPRALSAVAEGENPKGDVLAVARIAGIQAAKQTSTLIPLCHPVALTSVEVDATLNIPEEAIDIRAVSQCFGPTGVEMEAMVAAGAAALTVYDMVKGLARGATIESVRLLEKSGGKSGEWRASSSEP